MIKKQNVVSQTKDSGAPTKSGQMDDHGHREMQMEDVKKQCTKKRIKLAFSILLVLAVAMGCALLLIPQPEEAQTARRIPARYTQPELLTPEDRELFSDIRTSFIPTGSIALPPADDILNYERHSEIHIFETDTKNQLTVETNKIYNWVDKITSKEENIEDRRYVIDNFDDSLKINSDEFINQFNKHNQLKPDKDMKSFLNGDRASDGLNSKIVDEGLLAIFESLKKTEEGIKSSNSLSVLRQRRESAPENLTASPHMWQEGQKLENSTTHLDKGMIHAHDPEISRNETEESITDYLTKLARMELKDKIDDTLMDEAVREIVETAKIQLLGEAKIPESPIEEEEREVQSFWNSKGDPETIRKTQANIMKRHMDLTANPCEDFYQYACGNWPQLNPIPADKAGFDTFEMLRENLDIVLRDLLSSDKRDRSSESSDSNFDGTTNFLRNNFKRKTSGEGVNVEDSDSDTHVGRVPRMKRELEQNEDKPHADALKCSDCNNRRALPKEMRGNYKSGEFEHRRVVRKTFENGAIVETSNKPGQVENRFARDLSKVNKKRERRIIKRKAFYDFDATVNDENKVKLERQDIATEKAKYLYESCMNYEILEQRGHHPLIELLDSLGGWPIINPNWDESKFDWIELMANLRLYNNDILLSEWVGPDIKNSDEFVVQFDQTNLGLPTRDYFIQPANNVYLEAYKNYMIKIITLLGLDFEEAVKGAEEIIEFETMLAKITSAGEDRRNISELYQRLTVEELTNMIPKINWIKYLNIVFSRPASPNETVVIFALKYAEELVTLIEQTEPRTVANYLLWRFVRHRVNNLDDKFQEAKQRFYYILFGREQAPPRWKNCVAQVNSNMGMALGAMFVKKYFDENSKNDTLIMTREIQESFRELLNMTTWIDGETKTLATDKVDTMTLKIGYPDFILNLDELNEKYKEITVQPNTYFENTLNILKHLTKTEHAKLGQAVNKTQWNTAPALVNAYYSRNKNQIMFPAGILQPPFYHRYFPKSLNFGGIGVVIGHEITHGFDDKGRLFDKYGNLHRWWHDLDIKLFHKKAQCLIDQYSEYTVSEVSMSLDGVNTQGENIADNGGIKQAFRAYQYWLKQNGDQDETLPGLNATNTQLFFLNFAQVWCGAMRPEAMKNKLKTAVHSPGKFRVIGTVSNSEDFARVYNCPVGSPMNPSKKCNVW